MQNNKETKISHKIKQQKQNKQTNKQKKTSTEVRMHWLLV